MLPIPASRMRHAVCDMRDDHSFSVELPVVKLSRYWCSADNAICPSSNLLTLKNRP